MDTFILSSVKSMFTTVTGYLPTFLTILSVLVLGWVVARVISKLVARLLREIYFDTMCQHLGLAGILRKGGIKRTSSDVIGCMVYWVIMITVLATSVKIFGLPLVDEMVNRLFSYVPSVIGAVFVLTFGMILGNFISSLVRVVASNTDIPRPDIMGMLTKYAIVLFAVTIFLHEIGLGVLITGTSISTIFMSVCLALALAFGLGGRDTAARYLERLKK
jgi:hypothetical protein